VRISADANGNADLAVARTVNKTLKQRRRTDRMQKLLLAATIALTATVGTSGAARAQATDQPTYVVTYFEVAPKAIADTRGLLATHCTDARKASGLLEIDTLQRLGRANHFAILEKWQSAKAREDYAATDTAKSFVAGLGPVLISGYDERLS